MAPHPFEKPAMSHPEYILTLSCHDQRGIVYRVSGFLADHGCNIIDSAQFGDQETKRFFMRVHFAREDIEITEQSLRASLAHLSESMSMEWELHDAARKPRVMLMVSKIGHCLNDLLFRYKSGLLPVEIPAIVSNHMDFYQLADNRFGVSIGDVSGHGVETAIVMGMAKIERPMERHPRRSPTLRSSTPVLPMRSVD